MRGGGGGEREALEAHQREEDDTAESLERLASELPLACQRSPHLYARARARARMGMIKRRVSALSAQPCEARRGSSSALCVL